MFNPEAKSNRTRVVAIAAVAALAVGGVAATAALAGMGGGMAGGGMAHGAMGDMDAMEVKDEFGYLTMMIPHHEEAIASAEVLLAGTKSQRMTRFARDIINTQSAEVRQMKAWLATWYPGRKTAVRYKPMMRDLTKLSGAKLDQAFLQDMIGHHMMAVMMSQQLVARDLAEHDEVVPFAEKIRDTQRAEIRMMARWLGGRRGAGMPGGGGMGGSRVGAMDSMGGGGMGMGGMGH